LLQSSHAHLVSLSLFIHSILLHRRRRRRRRIFDNKKKEEENSCIRRRKTFPSGIQERKEEIQKFPFAVISFLLSCALLVFFYSFK